MVFPSLMFQVDHGFVSQFSAWAVLAFSFLLYRFKKIIMTLFVILGALIIFQSNLFAMMAAPSQSFNSCMSYVYCNNNMNYYGRAWGQVPPAYFYPQLPYHSFWPQPNYFAPHAPSPYYQNFDCPFCNQQQQYQPQVFPSFHQHPGGGAS